MSKKLSYTKQEDLDKPRFHVILTIVMIVMVLPLGIAWFLVRDSVEEPVLPIQVTSQQSEKTGVVAAVQDTKKTERVSIKIGRPQLVAGPTNENSVPNQQN